MDTTIKFDGQPMFEAVEVENALFNAKLAAELGAKPTIAQQAPCGLFRLGGAGTELANSPGGDSHGGIIAARSGKRRRGIERDSRQCPSLVALAQVTPHP